MSSHQKLVSIVVPAYNRRHTILETIQSVILQTYQNWELLIVDDQSEDNTLAILQNIFSGESRIKLLQRNRLPKGAPTCRNIGLENATGDYLIFLDSDDLLLSACLEKRVQAFEKNMDKDFIVFNSAFFAQSIDDAAYVWNRFDGRDDLIRFLGADVVWHTCGSFWKTKFLLQNNLFYNETAQTSQDWEFHLQVLLKKPLYNRIDAPADSFIRRNNNYEKISDTHGEQDRILNRITLMNHMLQQPNISYNPLYTRIFCITIMREFHVLLCNTYYFDAKLLLAIDRIIDRQDRALQKAYLYLKTANFLSKINHFLFRVYRKIFYHTMVKDLFTYDGFYRSAMTKNEISQLRAEQSCLIIKDE